jgi:UPF0271 protein
VAFLDLNADLGEGSGVPESLSRVCRAAAEPGARIGARVSYHDLAGFGRRFLDVSAVC